MEQKNIHINSLKAVRIEILSQTTKASLTFATGFLCSLNRKIFLVTNHHVVSGRHFQTNEFLHKSGAIPGYLKLEIHCVEMIREFTYNPKKLNFEINLYKSDENYDSYVNPIWFEHEKKSNRIDVVAIDISNHIHHFPQFKFFPFDLIKEIQSEKILSVMDEVFILGYPLLTKLTPSQYPIHKNATIASEPNVYKDFPLFYIDGKTKSGMSGSPVVKKSTLNVRNDNETISLGVIEYDLIGIYSGRESQAKEEYEAELGIVWRLKEGLYELIAGR